MKIAICDDDVKFACVFENILLRKYSNYPNLSVEVYFSGEKLCSTMDDGIYFDVIFSDIKMQKISGIDVGSHLRNNLENHSTILVFVSNYESYHKSLYPVSPIAFISKPSYEIELENVMQLINKKMKQSSDIITIRIRQEVHKIRRQDILFFESNKRKIVLHTLKYQLEFYKTMSEVFDLCDENFVQIHKSYIVNLNNVKIFAAHTLTMQSGDQIPIGGHYVKSTKEKVVGFLKVNNIEYFGI